MYYKNNERYPTVSATAILGFFKEFSFLSNFCYSNVNLDGLVYPSSEHAYMAQKTDDMELRKYISTISTPGKAKRFGTTMPIVADWDSKRLDAMYRVLTAKFEAPEVRIPLLDTGTKYLEETNDWGDSFWGCCEGYGGNHLGRTLMRVRHDILLSSL